ncbi:unnamed protein product [Aphanomyces euteiches]
MIAVEAWTAKQLAVLGVDSVFAPYVLGMLNMNGPASEDEEDEKRQEVLDLLMGWLDESHQVQAENFVDELLLYVKDPHQLALLHDSIPSMQNDTTEGTVDDQPQLKATASAFVPSSLEKPLQDDVPPPHSDEFEFDVEDEEAFYWSVAYELVEQLLVIFPSMDPERLLDLLKEVDLNVQRAQATMQGIVDSEQTKGNAQFLHDTHLIPCRYWIRGGCLQGDECAFAHSFAVAVSQYSAQPVEEEDEGNVEDQIEWNFPSLQEGNGMAKVAPSVEESLSLDFKRAVSTSAPRPPPTFSSSFAYQAPTKKQPGKSTTMSITQWVETGDHVAAQYQKARATARDLALARNQCFMNATRAFRANNKALAKSLSRQGQQLNADMKQAHFEAATLIFEARNPQYEVDGIVDLHGLHVAEAVELLAWLLPSIKTRDSICVVTGSGHHSHHQRLRPAVERFLTAEGYTFTSVPDRKGYVGMLNVSLRLTQSVPSQRTMTSTWLEEALADALGFAETQDIATFIRSIEAQDEIYDAVVQMIGDERSDIAHKIAARLVDERTPQAPKESVPAAPKPRPPNASPITNCLECGLIEYHGQPTCASCQAPLHYVDERPEAQEARAHRDRLLANDASLSQRTVVHDMAAHFDQDKRDRDEAAASRSSTIHIDLVNRSIEAAPMASSQAQMLAHLVNDMERDLKKSNVRSTPSLVHVGHVDGTDADDYY